MSDKNSSNAYQSVDAEVQVAFGWLAAVAASIASWASLA